MHAVVARHHADARGAGRTLSTYSGLTMYDSQPTDELTLYDFEVVALDRIRGETEGQPRSRVEPWTVPARDVPSPRLPRACRSFERD